MSLLPGFPMSTTILNWYDSSIPFWETYLAVVTHPAPLRKHTLHGTVPGNGVENSNLTEAGRIDHSCYGLHWLLVPFCVQFKVLFRTYKTLYGYNNMFLQGY